MKKLTFALLLAVAACGGSSKSSTTPPPASDPAPATADIVDTAVGAGSFTTLVAAVQAAGLVDTLKGDGPFTVFAPTDEAFAKLPPGTVEALLKDKAKLTAILTYHVVPGRVTAADVAGLTTATTVQGGALAIDTSAGVKINDATVVKADVMASNGVIHVIDTVLLPPM
ncbi:MAG: fasciclin domain-containing protein [Myxococcales bacterium]|nr:fasciclin domain-containing protein [Myxococcales bacterium]